MNAATGALTERARKTLGAGARWLAFAAALFALSPVAGVGAADYPTVRPGIELAFPRDHGAHPQYRIEWWYITGWLRGADGVERGMQITFFRHRPGVAEDVPGKFAPRQLLFAHAAVSDPGVGRLLHDQRVARAGFGLAEASEAGTDVVIDDWALRQTASGYRAEVRAGEFEYRLAFDATQPLLLQGERGVSRKGPKPEQASFYYSRPHLRVTGTLNVQGRDLAVTGEAWLDHEWSSEYLAPEAAGWDWVGLNLTDGGALMAFRIRDRKGGVVWAGGAHRRADGSVRAFQPGEVSFTPRRRWRSPRTQTDYPVAMRVQAGELQLELQPLFDDQELDSRGSTGTIYWEGAVRVLQNGQPAGRGYLELTGYWQALRF
jgi:predicted secreted hydrolase